MVKVCIGVAGLVGTEIGVAYHNLLTLGVGVCGNIASEYQLLVGRTQFISQHKFLLLGIKRALRLLG